jgi:hypothetical protein
MDSAAEARRADAEELRRLAALSTRPAVAEWLQAEADQRSPAEAAQLQSPALAAKPGAAASSVSSAKP